jgi:DNA invertase Pin-like site-specific DNA recombinase
MWQMIGVLAELERSLISERTRAGVKAAKGRGVKFGRKPKLTPLQIAHARTLIDNGRRREDLVSDASERQGHNDRRKHHGGSSDARRRPFD